MYDFSNQFWEHPFFNNQNPADFWWLIRASLGPQRRASVMGSKKYKYSTLKISTYAQTLPKQLQNNFGKVQKTTFSTPKIAKNYPSNRSKEGSILTENLDFRVHLWTFGAEKSPKSASFKTKNNAQTLPKQLQNKFEKVQKTTLSTPKWLKMTG